MRHLESRNYGGNMNLRQQKRHSNKIKVTKKYIRDMVRLLSKKEYELNLPKNAKDTALKVLELVHNATYNSHAGSSVIRINLGERHFYNRPKFSEYSAYRDDPVIGTINTTSHWDVLLVVVAHELAHHIQYRYAKYLPRYRKIKDRGHGDIFKSIYRYLRRDFVNKKINTDYTSHGDWDTFTVKPKVKVKRVMKDYKKLCELVTSYNDRKVRILEWHYSVAVYEYANYPHMPKDDDNQWEHVEEFYDRHMFSQAYKYAKERYKAKIPLAYRQ